MSRLFLGIICIVLSGIGLTACAQGGDMKPLARNIGREFLQPDSAATAVLGESVAEVLLSPTGVDVYTLQPKSEVEKTDYETEPHFVRKDFVGNLDKKFVDVVNYVLITDERNYGNDSTIAQTFYLPVIELEYRKKKERVSVIISPNDRTWTVVSGGKRILHFNYRNEGLVNRLVNGFMGIKPIEKDKLAKSGKSK